MKLSQWHDEKIKPVHIGFYQVICKSIFDVQSWSYWNGKKWSCQNSSGIEFAAAHMFSIDVNYQDKQWRGIIKDKE